MFSDHLKENRSPGPRRLLLLVVGALVMACQLVAMALLADGQVQKAALRDAQRSSERLAMAQCFETSSRMDRASCLTQARNDRLPDTLGDAQSLVDRYADAGPPSLPAAPWGLRVVSFVSATPAR